VLIAQEVAVSRVHELKGSSLAPSYRQNLASAPKVHDAKSGVLDV